MIPSETFFGFSPNAWVAMFTPALVGIGVLQALVYILMLRTTHRAERAYVYVDGITKLEDFGPDLAPMIQFDVKNSGRTPARILAHNAVFWVQPPGKTLPKKMPLKRKHLRDVDFWMITGHMLPVVVGFKNTISAEEYRRVMSGEAMFIVFGKVLYKDRFQWWGTRCTNFSFVLDHRAPLPTDPPGHHFGFSIANNSYNDAN